jgi:hypothetical protein
MKNNNVREVDFKEVFKYAEDVEVNGQESSVSGKLDFNQEKGTFTATVKSDYKASRYYERRANASKLGSRFSRTGKGRKKRNRAKSLPPGSN